MNTTLFVHIIADSNFKTLTSVPNLQPLLAQWVKSLRKYIYNGNWSEWSAIWSEITSMISDQNCTPLKRAVLKWEQKQSLSIFHASKFDSRRLNQWWKTSLLLWLRLRLLVVFGVEIWGCSRCNSAMDFFWVVICETPGNSLDCTIPSCREFSRLSTVQWHSAWF